MTLQDRLSEVEDLLTKGTIDEEEYKYMRKKYLHNILIKQGRDSNLRPSAPKALISHSEALGFQAISNFLLSSASFVVTNKVIFVRNLSAKYLL